MVVHPSSSSEQKEAGMALIHALSSSLGVALEEERLELGEGCIVVVDGYSDKPPILCEAWVHYGSPRGAQFYKIMKDAFKLVFIEKRKGGIYKKMLLFCDEDARKPFTGGSWQAQCLRDHGIETEVYRLPKELEQRIKKAQKRQRQYG